MHGILLMSLHLLLQDITAAPVKILMFFEILLQSAGHLTGGDADIHRQGVTKDDYSPVEADTHRVISTAREQ